MLKLFALIIAVAFLSSCITPGVPCQPPKERKGQVDYYKPSVPTAEEQRDCEINYKK